jgi:hypothetical protein
MKKLVGLFCRFYEELIARNEGKSSLQLQVWCSGYHAPLTLERPWVQSPLLVLVLSRINFYYLFLIHFD